MYVSFARDTQKKRASIFLKSLCNKTRRVFREVGSEFINITYTQGYEDSTTPRINNKHNNNTKNNNNNTRVNVASQVFLLLNTLRRTLPM